MNKSPKIAPSANAFTMNADEVCAALNISRQTLYAYVSRGKVRAQAQPGDARKSLYHSHDIDLLLATKKRGRSRRAVAKSTVSFGEPILKSEISEIKDGKIYYKGFDAIKLSHTATYEELATLLIDIDVGRVFEVSQASLRGRNSFERMVAAISDCATGLRPPHNMPIEAFITRYVLAAICENDNTSHAPAHRQLALHFLDDGNFEDICRRCLVLCADHELNASAFAARVAASTNAALPACLLAALSTFSGTKHGSMTSMARWWVGRAAMKQGKDQLDFIQSIRTPPGFGHPIYSGVDPRCAELLKYLKLPNGWAEVRDLVLKEHGLHPNLDFSLAVMEKHFGLRPKAGQTLFAYGRMLGWIAHAKEQQETGTLIRPRAFI